MATRLYPNTRNERVLELLAGVPEGTSRDLASLKRLEAHVRTQEPQEHDLGYDLFVVTCGAPVARFADFTRSGWGRVRVSPSTLEAVGGDDIGGSTTDPEAVQRLLRAQGVILPEGVSLSDLEGLHWC